MPVLCVASDQVGRQSLDKAQDRSYLHLMLPPTQQPFVALVSWYALIERVWNFRPSASFSSYRCYWGCGASVFMAMLVVDLGLKV